MLVAYVISVWGQSNAAGQENFDTFLPAEWRGNQATIRTAFYGLNIGDLNPLQFQPLNPAQNSGRVWENGILWGVEQSLTHLLADYYGRTIYLDKLAYGGKQIKEWQEGGMFWDVLNRIADDEKAYFAGNNMVPKWLPVIWIQGENNATDSTAVYQPQLEALIDLERSKSDPARPWIFQMLSTYQTAYTPEQRENINAAFRNIAGGTRPHCYVLDPSDYTLTMGLPPDVHYGPYGYQILGRAHFNLMKRKNLL